MDVDGAPSVARTVYRIGVQYYFHRDQPHNQSAQVRVWTDLARDLDRKESLFYSKRSLWLQSFPRWTWLRIVPFRACSRNLRSDDCSLVVVSTLTSNLRCLCRCGCGRANWRELSFFERHSWRDLCWPFRRLRHDKNIVFENAFMSDPVRRRGVSLHASVICLACTQSGRVILLPYGESRLPVRRIPSKLCATLACRGACAWMDSPVRSHHNTFMTALGRPPRLS